MKHIGVGSTSSRNLAHWILSVVTLQCPALCAIFYTEDAPMFSPLHVQMQLLIACQPSADESHQCMGQDSLALSLRFKDESPGE
jgi:hypothetical protein